MDTSNISQVHKNVSTLVKSISVGTGDRFNGKQNYHGMRSWKYESKQQLYSRATGVSSKYAQLKDSE